MSITGEVTCQSAPGPHSKILLGFLWTCTNDVKDLFGLKNCDFCRKVTSLHPCQVMHELHQVYYNLELAANTFLG